MAGKFMMLRVAVLVDGDNLSPSLADDVLEYARTKGTLDLARVYLDAQRTCAWHDQSDFRLQHAGTGKNASDLLMAVEAMELALREGFDCLVLASSDGDFSHLARRLRELGCLVCGVGTAKAPANLRAACSSFHEVGQRGEALNGQLTASSSTSSERAVLSPLDGKVRTIITTNGKNGRGMTISDFGQLMHKEYSVSAKSLQEGNWRAYLSARPALYELDPKGPNAKVRLACEGLSTKPELAAE
ncbi:NYN domain-containing protein [Lutimaribacter marinistellae]|uniref:NYN domain-containing protein n=1 Tax=Lutimaribacter marinistellae TaxID=1820329 RepID=A0ABV7T9Z3_9RHOB